MSRYIKRKLEKIKSEMDEVKFLLSDSYRLFLQKIVRGVTGRYELRVIFSDGVYTDNKIISVNPVHENVLRIRGVAEKTLVVLGQLAHEIFHVLYTDFKVLQRLERDYKDTGEFRLRQIHECLNIIEDSAIELAGTNYYTGSFKQAIISSNKHALKNMPSLDDMSEKGVPRLAIFKQACAMYCILGTVKGKLHDPELIELFKKAMPILDKGRLEPRTEGRYEAAKKLFKLMEPLIEEAIKNGEEDLVEKSFKYVKNNKISSGGRCAEVMEFPEIKEDFTEKKRKLTKKEFSKSSADFEDASKEEENDEANEDDMDEEDKIDEVGEDGNKDFEDELEDEDEKDESEEDENEGDEADEENEEYEESEEDEKGEEDEADTDPDVGEDEDGKEYCEEDKENEDSKEEDEGEDGGEEKEENTDDIDEENDIEGGEDIESEEEENDQDGENDDKNPDGESDESDSEMEELLDELEKQLEDVLDEAAKEEYDKQEQKEQDRRIREFARTVKFSELHSHIRPVTRREFEINEYIINKYNRTLEPIKGLARNLIKRMKDIIRYNEDLKVTGLISGKVNKSQLYRMGTDKLIFCKQREKSDEADLAVLLLVDESGSMGGGQRCYYAQLAAILLYEVCDALKIPLAVIGFDAKSLGDEVYHRHYVDFDSRDKREKYKLAYINARHENRDGYSVKYAGEYLARRPETDKILIVITDGEPVHPSSRDYYSGKLGIKDTGRVVKELEKMGINVFGLAIGDGKSEIKKIYTKNYIDIPNLKHLPGKLVNLIEKNLLKE